MSERETQSCAESRSHPRKSSVECARAHRPGESEIAPPGPLDFFPAPARAFSPMLRVATYPFLLDLRRVAGIYLNGPCFG